MLFWTIVKVAIKSLLANKLRSFLAMLGIIMGCGAVIAMLAIGQGARSQIMNRISSMGTNLLIVRSGQRHMMGVASGTSEKLTLEDAQVLLKEVKSIKMMAPVVQGSAQVKYMNKNTRCTILGASVTYLPIRDFAVEFGRAFTETEAERVSRVCMIGPVTKKNLFDENDAIGESIKINGVNFKVLGVMKSKGDQGFFNPDDQVIIPYTTHMKQILGVTYIREIDLQAQEGTNLTKMQEDATAVLRRQHRLQADAPDDFEIRNQADMIEMANSVSQTFTILLGTVACISLLVGGIGIMNIMLVTVTERTREIGIRKAIGAKNRDILTQFLLEAIIMSGMGGFLGVIAGVGASTLIGKMTQFTTQTQISSVLISLSFSGAVGIFFGFYPAKRAAQLDPIESLRYE
ncbi:MAG: ABC transporter permease [Candidatus Sumerlaeota bacterium]|nr:ABC transporter permease [Candidatus Sumerlaeota bacterium]